MKDNLHLKRGLITQSLSPVFALLVIRHVHFNYPHLIYQFFMTLKKAPVEAITRAVCHEEFGELLMVIIGIVWVLTSLLLIFAFKGTQTAGFESHGEKVKSVVEKKDAAASFLMTFILPLLIDDLSSPQNWISYMLVIVVVYSVLYQSNLYYQSPVLAFLGYKVFSFTVLNPYDRTGLKIDTEYIGVTRKKMIEEESTIMWKYVADDVFLVYNEGNINTSMKG